VSTGTKRPDGQMGRGSFKAYSVAEHQRLVADAVEQEREKWARLERMEKFILNTFPDRGATVLDLLTQIDTATEQERARCLAIIAEEEAFQAQVDWDGWAADMPPQLAARNVLARFRERIETTQIDET